MKTVRLFIIFITLLNLTGCYGYSYDKKEIENRIIISTINIDKEYKILSKDSDIKDIVMFEECGRPNTKKSNVVIGAHSGTSKYAYFNEIHKLKIDDEIIIYYNNVKYVYNVIEKREVRDTEIGILGNSDESILTLLTCKINDNSKRIVVISKLENAE